MSYHLLTPDQQTIPIPTTHSTNTTTTTNTTGSSKSSVWLSLGRGSYGIPAEQTLSENQTKQTALQHVSRTAAEILYDPTSPTGVNGPPRLRIRVLGRNPLFIQIPSKTSVPQAIPPQAEHEWPMGATLYLLHTQAQKSQYPFTYCANSNQNEPPTLSIFDEYATQDVTDLPIPSQQQPQPMMQVNIVPPSPAQAAAPGHSVAPPDQVNREPSPEFHPISSSFLIPGTASEMPTTASQLPQTASELQPDQRLHPDSDMKVVEDRASRKRPHSETVTTAVDARDHNDERVTSTAAAATSPTTAQPQSALPAQPPHVDEPMVDAHVAANRSDIDHDFQLDMDDMQEFNYAGEPPAAAQPGLPVEAASADGDEPANKKARIGTHHVIPIKRSLDFLSSSSTSTAPPPIPQFLSGYAVYIVSEGIGSRQLEILHNNVLKRGGLMLSELPKHKYHIVVDKEMKRKEKKRIQLIQQTQGVAAAKAAMESNPSVGERKLQILLIVSPSIRTTKGLQDVLTHQAKQQAAAEAAHSAHHLGVPRSVAGVRTPPGSPKSPSPGNSPSSTPASSPSSTSSTTVRLRSSWQIHHLEWLVDSFKRNTILPPDQFILDDVDPNKQLAAVSRRLDYPSSVAGSSAISTVPASTSTHFTTPPTSSAFAASAAASSTVAGGVDDDDDSSAIDNESKYSDEADALTTPTAIARWNQAIAAQLKETADKYSAQAGEHFRAIAFRRAAGVVGSLPYALKDISTISDVKGMGTSTLAEIASILKTGHSSRLEALQSDPVLKVHQLLQTVHGIGPKTAEKFYAQGIRTIDDLRTKAKLTTQQTTYLQYYDELRSPIPRGEVAVFEKLISSVLHRIDPQLKVVIAGSYRRGKPTCGDIDCLIHHPDPNWKYHEPGSKAVASSYVKKTSVAVFLEELIRQLHAIDILTDDLVTPSHKQVWKSKNIYESEEVSEMYCGIGMIPRDDVHHWGGLHRRVDLKVYHVNEFPFALMYFTGSKDFNRQMRLYANNQFGLSLSDKALSPYIKRGKEKVASGMAIPCKDEQAIFAALKMEYIPPTERDVIPQAFLAKTKYM